MEQPYPVNPESEVGEVRQIIIAGIIIIGKFFRVEEEKDDVD